MADFEPGKVCMPIQKFRHPKTALAWMEALCISRVPKRKALRKQVFTSMGQVPKVMERA